MKYLKLGWDFFTKNFKYVVIIVLTVIVMSVFKCGHSNLSNFSNSSILKAEIKQKVKAGDSLKKIVVKNDVVRIEYRIKYLRAKETIKFLPCDSAIKIIVHACDTLILVDSVEIANLKKVIVNDSLIIKDQFALIKNDSIAIHWLNKEVRKQKRQKKFILIGLGGLVGYSALRK